MISIPFRPLRPPRFARRDAGRRRAPDGAVALLAALLAAACASYEPRPLVPGDELATLRARRLDSVTIEHARPGEERAVELAFDLQDGLDEAELVAVALTLNPALRARRLEIGEAEALLVGAGLWPNPEIGLAVRPGIDAATSTGIELDVLLDLLRPGQRGARRRVALARLDAVHAEIAAEELRVVAAARRARLAVLAADEDARLLEGESALREEVSALLQRRRELGEATDLDLLLADLELLEIQRELREARAERGGARRALNELLGLPPTHELALAESERGLSFTVLDAVSDEELDRRILHGRFELRAQEARYRQAEDELRLALLRRLPALRLGPSFEKDVEGSEALGLGAEIELPLFDRNQGEIAEKLAAREVSRAEYVATLHAIRAAAFEARAEVERARAEVELQEREVLPLIERTEALFEGAFQAHELTVFEWITARTRALQARRELVRALVRYTGAAIELEAALGVTPTSGDTSSEYEER